jgi:hypothetical protein
MPLTPSPPATRPAPPPQVKFQGTFLGEHANFSTFPMALLTLFRMTTGENWDGLMQVRAPCPCRLAQLAGADTRPWRACQQQRQQPSRPPAPPPSQPPARCAPRRTA